MATQNSRDFFLGEDTPGPSPDTGPKLGSGLKRFAILDADGDCVGTASWADDGEKQRRRQRFIALSDARSFTKTEYDDWSSYTERKEPWQLYNVMMLEPKKADGSPGDPDEDVVVAYRAGIGKVFKSAFPNGINYGWKEVVLG
ncbi:hypothetical protein CLAFUW4_08169 [Fulvia fulva]|uniref:Uncharacterized protein n=1 Tax=Passalora fulva TaxID=5499 RepID=A0A9Q8LDP9_PASFU|nr:uncharacterized protein CLAFUR5_08283 [Fulvia fulva]KAK4628977.1 hypothetical protein CLAFUR4_08174 [Fulvia fulva]KAK4629775.1 hypothetical protein CLAFUR0_08169 [Fulvia fulva]UJO15499.1 hypothetical protein CLAFUR5_08283 [Fulvia fulva]WPV12145.1 hypothetical protein CLAFUW4_08169 [Fulvia fulva]WPV28018.1 hypothetical protein CLAFUW7_08169 [Fulvia fulva]